jgi:hypothetical protein
MEEYLSSKRVVACSSRAWCTLTFLTLKKGEQIAQSVERPVETGKVVGSMPALSTNFYF